MADAAISVAQAVVLFFYGPPPGFDAGNATLFFPYRPARLARCYGTLAFAVLGDAASLADCGEHFGHSLTAREVRYLMEREWALTADDVLWRRSKLGLRLSTGQAARLAAWMEGQCRTT